MTGGQANIPGLDVGIRKTVQLLREHGYETSDSGDGTGPGSTPRPWEKRPCGHVAIPIHPTYLAVTADGVRSVLEGVGLTAVPQGMHEPPEGSVIIEASYNPAEGVGLVIVSHVLDRMWSR